MRYLLLGVVVFGATLQVSCSEKGDDAVLANARPVVHRSDLVGGQRSLGEVEDILMENDQIRVVIQKEGFSRGFGVYGGSLIDADLRRPVEQGDSLGATGFDGFGELFPAFFLQAVAVDKVEIINDGSDGGPARVRASGNPGDFLELVGVLNRAAIGSHQLWLKPDSDLKVNYSTTYELAPGARHVKITFAVKNLTEGELLFPSGDAAGLLAGFGLTTEGFTLPVADIALFGKTHKIFLPGTGYDLRFSLDDAYDADTQWPAFPGLIADWVVAKGKHVSYGLIQDPKKDSWVYNKRDFYPGKTITKSSLLLPFVASGFIGLFYEDAPASLAAGESFEVNKYFILGTGDVGSVLDEINSLRGTKTGRLSGQVIEEVGGAFTDDAEVLVYTREGDERIIYAEYATVEGNFTGTLAPGKYSARAVGHGRPIGPFADFEVKAGKDTGVRLLAQSAGRIVVNIYNEAGVAVPSKATAVGTIDKADKNKVGRSFLYDLTAGEEFRSVDLVPDTDDAKTRKFIEAHAFAPAGVAEMVVRPGTYTVYASRGPEYDVASETVVVTAGGTASVAATVKRVVDTTGWISSDLHLHSVNSIDSGYSVEDRVVSCAAEGVEWAVSTDHNYVTDFGPYIDRLGLRDFMSSSVGIEATTLESGHFNGYPLDYQVSPVTHGAFEWAGQTPDEIFAEIRALGAHGEENTIVQVNHPRDTILGYFGQYDRNGLTFDKNPGGVLSTFTSPTGPAFIDEELQTTFSFDFDAIELLNGKLFWLIRHYRVPAEIPEGEIPEDVEVPPEGTILMDGNDVAFPGVIDDWFNLLNLGHTYLGVGTSDTHSGEDEAGYFRTMVYVGKDAPSEVKEIDFVKGLKSKRVYATNGPMIDLRVNDGQMGSTVIDKDGEVKVTVRVTAAPWIGTRRLNLYRNGLLLQAFEVPDRDLAAKPFEETVTVKLEEREGSAIDSWFVLEAIGDKNMFPVVRPAEFPPLAIADAVASIAAPLGFGGSPFGPLKPAEIFPVTGYAVSNPIWVQTAGGRDFEAPGIVPTEILNEDAQVHGFDNNPEVGVGEAGLTARPGRKAARLPKFELEVESVFKRNRDNPHDFRTIFESFGRHLH